MKLHKYWEKTGAEMDLPDFGKKIYLHNIFVCLFIYSWKHYLCLCGA